LLCVSALWQRGIDFDQLFGWEYSLLEPQNFWNLVPKQILPFLHFFNAPVTADPEAAHNVLRIIKQVATPDDFVSFKLDIDAPDVEIPIALALAQDAALASLVDEFFFELHFRCEFLMYCGWGTGIAETSHGLRLNTYNAMKLFMQLREMGVRSHFWP